MVAELPTAVVASERPPLVISYVGDRLPQSARLLSRRLKETHRLIAVQIPPRELRADFAAVGVARLARILAADPGSDLLAVGATAWAALRCTAQESLTVRRLILSDPHLSSLQSRDLAVRKPLHAMTVPTLLMSSSLAAGHRHLKQLRESLPAAVECPLHPLVGHWLVRFPAPVCETVAEFLSPDQ